MRIEWIAWMLVMLPSCFVVKADEPSKAEQVHIAVQGMCPVSGKKLGEQGAPVKSKIGEEMIYLCCKGCAEGTVNKDHWATIHDNFAKAQRICPVMKHELPPNAKWTIVEGQIYFVCCPPCTKKITSDPKGFQKQIDELYTASLEARKKTR